MVHMKRKRRGRGEEMTKREVLKDPEVAKALLMWHDEKQKGSGRKMSGKGWWDDFTGWLKKNHVISNLASIGSAITGAVGLLPLSAGLAVASGASSIAGYGVIDFVKKHKLVSRGLNTLASVLPRGQNALDTGSVKNQVHHFANIAHRAGYGGGNAGLSIYPKGRQLGGANSFYFSKVGVMTPQMVGRGHFVSNY